MVKSFNTTVLDLHVLYWRHTVHLSALYVPYCPKYGQHVALVSSACLSFTFLPIN